MTWYPEIDRTKKPNKCCKDETNLNLCDGGDGVEFEIWECNKCNMQFNVPIQIQRWWEGMEVVADESRCGI